MQAGSPRWGLSHAAIGVARTATGRAHLAASSVRTRPGRSLGQRGERMAPLRWGARENAGVVLGTAVPRMRMRLRRQMISA
jgi:hypothetical protein